MSRLTGEISELLCDWHSIPIRHTNFACFISTLQKYTKTNLRDKEFLIYKRNYAKVPPNKILERFSLRTVLGGNVQVLSVKFPATSVHGSPHTAMMTSSDIPCPERVKVKPPPWLPRKCIQRAAVLFSNCAVILNCKIKSVLTKTWPQ